MEQLCAWWTWGLEDGQRSWTRGDVSAQETTGEVYSRDLLYTEHVHFSIPEAGIVSVWFCAEVERMSRAEERGISELSPPLGGAILIQTHIFLTTRTGNLYHLLQDA